MNLPSTSIRNGDAVYWACQILGWAGYSAFSFSLAVQADGWRPALIVGYAMYPLYSIGLTHLLRRWIRRWRDLPRPDWLTFVKLFLAALATGLVQTLLIGMVDMLTNSRDRFFYPRSIIYTALGTTSAVGMWIFLYYIFSSNRRHSEQRTHLQSALRDAELRALEAQISPDFLFNCLHSISAVVPGNPARAQDMIAHLVNIFRHKMHREPGHTVPLATEMELAGDYVKLESVRLEDRLRVRFAISPTAGSAPVPSMLVQTLVERVLKHAVAPFPSGGDLLIRADTEADTTRIEVEYAPSQASVSEPEDGGLANTRERLRLLYGGRASLQLRNYERGRVVVTVRIPSSVSA